MIVADFNKVLTPGDVASGLVNTVIEIPEGSTLKVEWDRQRAAFMLDRVEPSAFPKPCSYGFIPQTIDEDGDELDTLVVCDEPIQTGVWFEAKILGVMKFEDDGEVDDKIIVRVADDRNDGDWINSLEDLGESWKEQIAFHFTHYKDFKKPGTTKVTGWGGIEEAKTIINKCIERYSSSV
jgi:inorganic pyrophosphatase